jgi:hypothetical protein
MLAFRSGSKAAVAAGLPDVGLPPDSGGMADIPQPRLRVRMRKTQREQIQSASPSNHQRGARRHGSFRREGRTGEAGKAATGHALHGGAGVLGRGLK